MRRSRVVLELAFLTVLFAAGSALAQRDRAPYVKVLGPTAQGATLEVKPVAGRPCILVNGPGGDALPSARPQHRRERSRCGQPHRGGRGSRTRRATRSG